MEYVTLSAITIPDNRQRREFDAGSIELLAQSIIDRGLLHPITLRNSEDVLVTGERRLRAITEIYSRGGSFMCNGSSVPPGTVPSLRLHDLSAVELEEVELEENTIRVDLSWQELANAQARLHNLRVSQKEGAGEVQTLKATATEILGKPATGGQVVAVRDNILLNNFLDDPEVAKAKTRTEAMSIVKKKLIGEFSAKLAQNFDANKATSSHTLIHGDSREVLVGLPDNTYDVIITDPPYGINAHTMMPLSGSQAATEHEYLDTLEYAEKVWDAILNEGFRITRPDAALYMFCDFRFFSNISMMATLARWTVWSTPLIWHKPSGGMLGDVAHGPRKSYEVILFAYKGDKRTTGTYLDVIVKNPGDSQLHAANKPVDLYVDLLKRSSVPGMKVIDPCCGSGPIFPAANALRLTATGIEVVERHHNIALSRLGETP